MPVNIEQWRASIGLFQPKLGFQAVSRFRDLTVVNYKVIVFLVLLLLSHCDIEVNPVPKRKLSKLRCCHWNVNSILAHNKLFLITTYNTVQKSDIICISETYLNSSVNENLLLIPGYHLLRADHPDNPKKGGVCLYYKENLGLRQIETPYFTQCILCELTIQNKVGYIAVIYRSPNQPVNEFDDFLLNFEKLLIQISQLKSSFLVILGDFNARSRSLWCEDITSHETTQLESLTVSCGLHQLTSDPTHLLPNPSSFIELIFTDQPNLVVGSGVHPSLHSNCHHQITFSRYNLTVEYPPPYERLVWDYNKANTESIKKLSCR